MNTALDTSAAFLPGGARLRAEEFPEAADGIYLNAASFGLLPSRTRAVIDRWSRERASGAGVDPERFNGSLMRARAAAGHLIGEPVESIALAPNTSYGVNLAAEIVGAGAPGRILLSDGEFPANVLPWKRLSQRGFEVEVIPADAQGLPRFEAMEERLARDSSIRAVAISMVQFGTGVLADLAAWGARCREREVFLAVDAIQGLGVSPLEGPGAMGVDLLTSGAQKWLLSPWGTGFLYLHPRHLDRIHPPFVSWFGFESALDFEELLDYESPLLPDARRFEPGTLPVHDMEAMAASIELLLEVGIDRIRDHVHGLHDRILEWAADRPGVEVVTPRDAGRRAGILSLAFDEVGEPAAALERAGIAAAIRGGRLRLAPHLYNTSAEIDELLAVVG
ncbi:MAG: aminotransferase class V-fold PLP-dependent enzyme [Gemmatimonadales bacterium]|nr:MAG: aminotransferase class V-fold PLP-dependent enzyme [Gemmatimonadales bacterium]